MLIALEESDNQEELLLAIKDYQHSLLLFDKDDKCLNNLGLALIFLGERYENSKSASLYLEAVDYLNAAVRIKNEKSESYLNLGLAYFYLYLIGNEDNYIKLSISNYEKAESLSEGMATHYLMKIYSILEDKEYAIKYFIMLKDSGRLDFDRINKILI